MPSLPGCFDGSCSLLVFVFEGWFIVLFEVLFYARQFERLNANHLELRSTVFAGYDVAFFHFAQIDMSVDYDLWAEKDGRKSATKTVSSWDARKEFISDLRLK